MSIQNISSHPLRSKEVLYFSLALSLSIVREHSWSPSDKEIIQGFPFLDTYNKGASPITAFIIIEHGPLGSDAAKSI